VQSPQRHTAAGTAAPRSPPRHSTAESNRSSPPLALLHRRPKRQVTSATCLCAYKGLVLEA